MPVNGAVSVEARIYDQETAPLTGMLWLFSRRSCSSTWSGGGLTCGEGKANGDRTSRRAIALGLRMTHLVVGRATGKGRDGPHPPRFT